jgi:alpha-tubulin suppressor-like RCC1 family protein
LSIDCDNASLVYKAYVSIRRLSNVSQLSFVALYTLAIVGCVSPRSNPLPGPDGAVTNAPDGGAEDGSGGTGGVDTGDAAAALPPSEAGVPLDGAVDVTLLADAADAPPLPDAPGTDARDTAASDEPGPPVEAGGGSANGAACSGGTGCASGYCVDGVCCDGSCAGTCEACAEPGSKGSCVPVTGDPRGARAGCAGKGTACGGTCDGSKRAACTYPGTQKECVAASCTSGVATARSGCDGQGACPSAMTVPCSPFSCEGTICAGGCSAASPCTAGNYCEAGRCNPKKAPGAPCLDGSQCGSGACVDGVCCQGACDGACQACNLAGSAGTCASVKSADDDHCNGQMTCDPAGACKRRLGSGCTGTGDCTSGYCVDGVCCNRACQGQCESCAEAASPGTCAVVAGAPRSPRAACGGTAECAGSCGGSSASCTFPAVACGAAASCTGNTLNKRGACSAGVCQAGGTQSCGAYACSASAGACLTTCGGAGDCAPDYTCSVNQCVTKAVSVATGANGSCAVLMSGKVMCWGNPPGHPAGSMAPYEVPGLSNVARMFVGLIHSCALTRDNKILCWGANGGGQLGDGTYVERTTPQTVPSVAQPWTSVTDGCVIEGHALAIVGGAVYGWGSNSYSAIGQPASLTQTATPLVVSNTGTATLLGCGQNFGVSYNGAQLCSWGQNSSGQASSDAASVIVPPVCVSASNIVEMNAGGAYACARLSSGGYRCWGDNTYGQYGMGQVTAMPPPGVASTGVTIKRLAASNFHACAIFDDNRLRCWGGNMWRQLGSGSTANSVNTPQLVQDLGTDITDVSSNGFAMHTCVLRADGSVWCWGNNDNGQIGTGSTSMFVDRPTRVQW